MLEYKSSPNFSKFVFKVVSAALTLKMFTKVTNFFARKFVTKNFQKSPNRVTLVVDYDRRQWNTRTTSVANLIKKLRS